MRSRRSRYRRLESSCFTLWQQRPAGQNRKVWMSEVLAENPGIAPEELASKAKDRAKLKRVTAGVGRVREEAVACPCVSASSRASSPTVNGCPQSKKARRGRSRAGQEG